VHNFIEKSFLFLKWQKMRGQKRRGLGELMLGGGVIKWHTEN